MGTPGVQLPTQVPYIVDLNGSAGAFVNINANAPIRRFKIRESLLTAEGVANTPQGLQYTLYGGTVTLAKPAPSTTNEPSEFPTIEFPDPDDMSFHAEQGYIIGMGPDSPGVGVAPTLVGTLLASVKSLTATATSVEVIQIP